MSYTIDAVRLVNVGQASAQLTDLTLLFSGGDGPVESVIWLKNGGGKSSIIALTSAVVLPRKHDFTGAGRDSGRSSRPRQLEDYILDGTGHTAIAWSQPCGDLYGSRRQLLTGAVYEWPERRRLATNAAGRDVDKWWWAAVPNANSLTLATLPVRSGAHGTGSQLTSAQFKDRLRQLNTDDPSLQVAIFSTMKEWTAFLEGAGIDTALYRYQSQMNKSEGGIADIFTFSSARDFVNFVLDIVASPSQGEECAEILTRHAENLFARPMLMLEQRFLEAAGHVLGDLSAAHELVRDAEATVRTAEESAVQLRRGLLVGAELRRRHATELEERQKLLQGQLQQARSDRKSVEDVRDELLRLAAVEQLRQAEEKVEASRATRAETHAAGQAWTAAEDLLLEAAELVRATHLTEQLRPERQQREALAADHDAVATAYRLHLQGELADVSAQEQQLSADKTEEQRQRREELKARDEARKKLREADRSYAGALAEIRTYLTAVRDAVAAGVLDGQAAMALLTAATEPDAELGAAALVALPVIAGVESLATARARHEQTCDRQQQRADRMRGEAHTARQEAAQASQRAAGCDELAAASEVKAAQAMRALEQLVRRRDELSNAPRLMALVEADGPINVWSESGALRTALTAAIRSANAQVLADAVISADAQRLTTEVDTNGLLPSPLGVDQVIDRMRAAGIAAQTAWRVLVRDHGPRLGPQGLRDLVLRHADTACAVVVQDNNARDRALSATADDPTLLYLPVVTTAELALIVEASSDPANKAILDTQPPAPVVPVHEGLWSGPAAAAAADQLCGAAAARVSRRLQLEEQAEGDQLLRTELDAFLRDFPLQDAVEAAQSALAELESDAPEQRLAGAAERGRSDELTQRAEGLEEQADEARNDARTAANLRDAAEALTAKSAHISDHRLRLEAADTARRTALGAESAAEERLTVLSAQAQQHVATTERLRARRAQLTRDVAAVRVVQEVPAEPAHLPALTTEDVTGLMSVDGQLQPDAFWQRVSQLVAAPAVEVATRWQELSRQWTAQAGQSVLEAQLDGASKAAAAHRERATSVLDAHARSSAELDQSCRDQADAIATTPSMTVEQIRAGRDEALQRAQAAVAAESEASTRRKQAEEAVKLRAPSDRPRHTSTDVGFTTVEEAEERATALSARATDMSGAETRLDNEAQAAGLRAGRLVAEATRLRDLAVPLPAQLRGAPFTPAGVRATELDGEMDLIRTLLARLLDAAPDEGAGEQADLQNSAADGSDGFGWWVRLDADLEEVRELVEQAGERVALAGQEYTEATAERQQASTRALQLAGQPEYQALPLKLRDRLLDPDPRIQAERAAALAEQVTIRLTQVDAVLTSSAENERAVTKVVSSHVRQLLDALAGAARASRIPEGLHQMSGRQFFTLRFANPEQAELADRVAQEVRSVLDAADGVEGRLPSGAELLKRCVHASVGARGFAVRVLKPNEHMLAQEVPVTDVSLFSDGEKLTTCILLFCAFARMRQQERRRAAGAAGAPDANAGTLVLDNPFGKASAAELVALQLAVARVQGVHLVFATGLDDMGALLQFRNILRLRNRKASHVPGGFIRTMDIGDRTVTGVAVTRPDAPVPPVLLVPPDDVDAGRAREEPDAAAAVGPTVRVADDGAA